MNYAQATPPVPAPASKNAQHHRPPSACRCSCFAVTDDSSPATIDRRGSGTPPHARIPARPRRSICPVRIRCATTPSNPIFPRQTITRKSSSAAISSSRNGAQFAISSGSGLFPGGAQRTTAVIQASFSIMPSSRCFDDACDANPARCSSGYRKSPDPSPVNGRPVRFDPCAPGASPTNSTRARGSPNDGTGLPQYSHSRYARRFFSATVAQCSRSRAHRIASDHALVQHFQRRRPCNRLCDRSHNVIVEAAIPRPRRRMGALQKAFTNPVHSETNFHVDSIRLRCRAPRFGFLCRLFGCSNQSQPAPKPLSPPSRPSRKSAASLSLSSPAPLPATASNRSSSPSPCFPAAA